MLVEGSYKEGCMPNSLTGHSAVNTGGFVPFMGGLVRRQGPRIRSQGGGEACT